MSKGMGSRYDAGYQESKMLKVAKRAPGCRKQDSSRAEKDGELRTLAHLALHIRLESIKRATAFCRPAVGGRIRPAS